MAIQIKSVQQPAESDPGADPPPFTRRYANFALGILVVVYVFNYLDRQILYMLLEDIKLDLDLSDTQLGFLGGIAFAIFYSTLGIPIARLADRSSRRSIIAWAMFVWSGMTALTGLAQNFWQIALTRIGVGIGEAGCSPPAHSLVSDFFAPERRATALGIYALGIPIGAGIGMLAGGWLQEWIGWRRAFLAVGLPGIVLAVVVRILLIDPPRGYSDRAAGIAHESAPDPPSISLREAMGYLLGKRSFAHMSFASALHAFYAYGAGAFLPLFFRRVHEMSAAEVGTYLGLLSVVAGVLGTFLGGWVCDRIGVRDKRWYLWLPAIAMGLSLPFILVIYLHADGRTAILTTGVSTALGTMWLGPTFSMAQSLAKPQMRALASAMLLLIINLIGMGLGPQSVGILSDLLAPTYGVDSVRYALLSTTLILGTWSTLHYILAARSLREDLER